MELPSYDDGLQLPNDDDGGGVLLPSDDDGQDIAQERCPKTPCEAQADIVGTASASHSL